MGLLFIIPPCAGIAVFTKFIRKKFGIKPDDIIDFLSNEPPTQLQVPVPVFSAGFCFEALRL
jgi:hypothetical protein